MSDVDSGYRERLTIEELAADCLDVRELNRKGLLKERIRTLSTIAAVASGRTMRADRY